MENGGLKNGGYLCGVPIIRIIFGFILGSTYLGKLSNLFAEMRYLGFEVRDQAVVF